MKKLFSTVLAAALQAFLSTSPAPALAETPAQYASAGEGSGPIKLGGVLRGSPVWESYRRSFVTAAGRVVDTGNGAVSHSEGQGYGMLLAVAAVDRPAFDSILTWTIDHLNVRLDNLAAWRWTGASPAKQDKHNATDGDILMAWALAEAADLWDDPAYLSAAQAITADIIANTIKQTRGYGPVLMPGAEGFSSKERPDGPVVNLSYWVYPAFYRLAQIEPTFDWNALMQSGLSLLEKARFSPARLPPDWLSLGKGTLAPAQGFDERFGYDAIRIPLYLFWAEAETLGRLQSVEQSWSSGAALIGLSRTPAPGMDVALSDPGYQSVNALVRCGTKKIPYPEEFYRFTERQHYYPATIHILSLIAARMRGGPCLNADAMRPLVSQTWSPKIGSLARLEPSLEPAPVVLSPPRKASRKKDADKSDHPFEGTPSMQDETDIFSYLRIIAGACTVIAGFYWLTRRSGAEQGELNAYSAHDESAIATAVSAIQPAASKGQYAIVPRTLPQSPFSASSSATTLGAEIEIAAAACVRLSRTVGLIYFEVPRYREIEIEHGAEAADQAIETLAADFRRALRATDNVAVLNRDQIVVCICLLASRKDLETVASRLSAAARRRDMVPEDAPSLPVGLALYPLDGYGGADLIDSARSSYRRLMHGPDESPAAADAPEPVESHHAQRRRRARRRSARKTQTPQSAA